MLAFQLRSAQNHATIVPQVATLSEREDEQRGKPMQTEESQPNRPGNHSFDELAKGLATGTVSRRQALRLFGCAVLGGVLASTPVAAWAQTAPPA